MDAGVVEAAAALVPHRAEAGDAVLKTMLAVLNALVDLLTALDVVPDLIPQRHKIFSAGPSRRSSGNE